MKTLVTIGLIVGVMAVPQSVANTLNNSADILSVLTNKPVFFIRNQFVVITKIDVFGRLEEGHNLFTGEKL